MSKKRYVSHSSIDDYLLCPRKYKHKRIDRIVPIELKSAFFFGSAIDAAVECIFLSKKKNLTEEEKELASKDYLDVFTETLSWGKDPIIREKVYVPTHPHVSYSKSDIQFELLTEDGLNLVYDQIDELGFIVDEEEELKDFYNRLDSEDQEQASLKNYISFVCLYEKGVLILPEVEKWCEENVEETISIQREIRVEDEDDILVGKNDLEVILKDGTHRLIDFKTTSIKYKENDANESQQLTIYGEMLGIDNVGFLVFEKNIRKREPRVRHQYIEGKLTDEQKFQTFKNIENGLAGIDSGEFPKDYSGCYRYGKCEYYDLCKYGSMKGLAKQEKKKKD